MMEEQPEKAAKLQKQEEREKKAEEMVAPSAEAPVAEVADVAVTAERSTRQRKSIKPMKMGDQVEVYSHQHKQWMLDGEVLERVEETGVRDGISVPAGAIKVVFNHGRHFRWMP